MSRALQPYQNCTRRGGKRRVIHDQATAVTNRPVNTRGSQSPVSQRRAASLWRSGSALSVGATTEVRPTLPPRLHNRQALRRSCHHGPAVVLLPDESTQDLAGKRGPQVLQFVYGGPLPRVDAPLPPRLPQKVEV